MRPMTDVDREQLRQRGRDIVSKASLWLLMVPLVASADWLVFSADEPNELLVGLLGLATLGVPVVLLLVASNAYERRRPLVLAARRGEVEVFRGKVGALVAVDPTLVKLSEEGFFDKEGSEEHEVELLPPASVVHQVDDRFVSSFLKAEVLVTATPRTASALVGEPGASRVVVLTDEEQQEIRTRAGQLWKTPGPLIFLVFYLGLGVFMWRVGGSEWLDEHGWRFAIFSLLAVAALWRFIGRVRVARRLERDAEQGEAVMAFADAPNPDGTVSQLMILPHSQMVWSLDGQPAEWRSDKL